MLKVSAIVPVYNPGRDIDDCIRSLVHDQSLARDEYEVIFVDDGSTDDTPARLDALAAEHAHVRVEHIPNSGWPGRPRNVGMDMARGEFVFFVDNDDWVGAEALERVHAAALRDDADVVIGKVVGNGKYVPRGLFRRNRSGVTLEASPLTLLSLLTPHRLYRKSLLSEHGIRFPEGRRRLEDHVFNVLAYLNARSVTIVADYPCYHWVIRRGDDTNASYTPLEPEPYFQTVREVLDLVEENVEPRPLRDELLSHWYKGKMLGRVGGRRYAYMPRRDPAYRRELYEHVRKLALERFDARVDEWLAPSFRVRSQLLRAGDFDSLQALAVMEGDLRVDAKAQPQRGEAVPFEARLLGDRVPLRFSRDGERIVWQPPDGVAPGEGPLDVTEALPAAKIDLTLRRTSDKVEYLMPVALEVRLEEAAGGTVEPVLAGEMGLSPEALAGGPLPEGRWEVLAVMTVAGFTATNRLRDARSAAPVKFDVDADGQIRRAGGSAEARASLAGRAARRMPALARVYRRARGAVR